MLFNFANLNIVASVFFISEFAISICRFLNKKIAKLEIGKK